MSNDTNPSASNSESPAAEEGRTRSKELLPDDNVSEGLTDDQRVSREGDSDEKGARVTPGPADEERLSK
jgi:hypothetical protein